MIKRKLIKVKKPLKTDFASLSNEYMNEGIQSWIEPVVEKNEPLSAFRYFRFPQISAKLISKRLDDLLLNSEDNKIKLQSYSMLNPPQEYTKQSINFIIWLICWKETYNYHRENEKPVHIIKLVDEILKRNIQRVNIAVIISAITTEIASSSNYQENLNNLMFFFQHIKSFIPYAEDKARELYKIFTIAKLVAPKVSDSRDLEYMRNKIWNSRENNIRSSIASDAEPNPANSDSNEGSP